MTEHRNRSTMMQRTCTVCGVSFLGGPSAKYCQSCRLDVKRERCRAQKDEGPSRKLGTVDRCELCGNEYTVTGGMQRYCPSCAKQEYSSNEHRRKSSAEYMRMQAKAEQIEHTCAVCGKTYTAPSWKVTCSDECAEKLAEINAQRPEYLLNGKRQTLRICRICGETFYDPRTGITLCRKCASEQKRKAVLKEHICKSCGSTFIGGTRAYYCPDCRLEIKRARGREYKRNGTSRPLGSTDICELCGKEYTVTSGIQRFCKACGEEKTKQQNREGAKKRMNKIIQSGNRPSRSVQRVCVVCGAAFTSNDSALTCSPECSQKLRIYRQIEKNQYE